MRLEDALKNGHNHAINRTGTCPIEVIAGYADWPVRSKWRVLVREVLDENPLHVDPRKALFEGRTEADAEHFLTQSEYNVNPDAWYPFDAPKAL
jgi:hypothetical protein